VHVQPLGIAGAVLLRPALLPDERGVFTEWLRQPDVVAATGAPFPLAQANLSVSARGTVRGIHFSTAEPGQAKYVTCAAGSVRDVVVDVRVGSPTFGRWVDVVLDDVERACLLIAPGLGHAFQARSEGATLVYLCSTPYDPATERAVDPFDPALGIAWSDVGPVSAKDRSAPGLAQAAAQGVLPRFGDAVRG
jgi:dTDP-4-dehydrorhamnose 3,5-epimerase